MNLRDICKKEFIKENGKFNNNRTRSKNNKSLLDLVIQSTQFLPEDATIPQRIWHTINDDKNSQFCKGGNPRTFISYNQGYNLKCNDYSCVCYEDKNKNSSIRLKDNNRNGTIQKGLQKKYGVDHVMKIPGVREKISKAKIEGADEWKVKFRSTMRERYGVDYSWESKEIRSKYHDTMQERYGAPSVFESHSLREKHLSTMRGKYGVENVSRRHLIDIIHLIDDEEWWESQESFISFYDFLKEYMNEETAKQYIKRNRPDLYPNFSSIPEKIIQHHLSSKRIDFIINDRGVIAPLELDIFIPSKNLAIEVNGVYWHSELAGGKDETYHQNKFNLCRKAGIQLMQFTDAEVIHKKDVVLSMIANKTGDVQKVYARQCTPHKISHRVATDFMRENHIQGAAVGSKRFGLFHKDVLIAVLIISKPRYSKADWEILRFAVLRGYSCVGAFSKLLKYSGISGSVVSYSSNAYSLGNVYDKTGWEKISENSPGYSYTKDYRVLYHRSRFQKHKLPDLLEVFDPSQTEWQNMMAAGYDRIWDAGTMTWKKTF